MTTDLSTIRAPSREMWALLYLHDWDPPNVWPEIHKVFATMQDADAARYHMKNPEKYWVRRVNVELQP